MTQHRPARLGLPRNHLVVVVTGALAASTLPGHLEAIRAWYPEVEVRVLVTGNALTFVTPAMLRTASRREVLGPGWFDGSDLPVPHREIAAWADAVVVFPASGNSVAKLAAGIGDSLALAVVQDAECPVVLVPSVSAGVMARPLFTENVERLSRAGFTVLETVEGRRASDGSLGPGAPAELPDILMAVARAVRQARPAMAVVSHHQ